MTVADTQKSVPTLVRDLFEELKALVTDEVRLAKQETSEKIARVTDHLLAIGIGLALALPALFILATALSRGLTSLFAQFMDLEVAVWLAPLMLAVALGVTAYTFLKKGIDALRRESLVPQKTVTTLKEDKRWIQDKTS